MGKIKIFFLYVLLIFSISACHENMVDDRILEKSEFDPIKNVDMTIIGKKLENPYSVVNMRKAWENIKSKKADAIKFLRTEEIEATHYYVKFVPKNEDELDRIKKDSTLT